MQKTAFSLYDASAGSGKTYTLVKEYLKIILLSKKPDAYRTILAITFTNKAVHEMKSRVVESLSEFAKAQPSEKAFRLMEDLQRETGMSLPKITEKAKEIIKNLIHNYAAFDISTIDKFTHKVIRSFAHDLNLPITFEVSLDTESLLAEAVDAIIAEAGNDKTLTDLLVDFTMEKTDDDKSWDVSQDIMNTGKLILNENNREEITHFQHKTISEFIEIKSKLKSLTTDLEDATAGLAADALVLLEKNGVDLKSFSGGYFPKHLISIKEKRFNPSNKTYHSLEDIKINKTAQDEELIQSLLPEVVSLLDLIYKKFERKHFYEAFLKNITPLSLLHTVSTELAKIQKEQNVLSIAEFNKIINEQIQHQPAPFIYERLGEKYRHFFIDEFQDTSQMQWQNLIPLIDNALSSEDLNGEQGSLLIVGDPKQSIYRWRGGKAEQFIALSKEENPFVNKDKRLFTLGTNYRSYSQVIDFNNQLFGFLSERFTNEDYKDLYQNHSHQEFNSKKGGYVHLSFVPKIDKESLDEEEALGKKELYLEATMATLSKVKENGFSYKDIVILTRKKAHGTAIATYLTEQNIPILSSETLLLAASSEVQCLIHFLHYLKNSKDLQSKANFLYYLALQQKEMAVHDFIAQGMEHRSEVAFQEWLVPFNLLLSFGDIRKKSLYEAVEMIISKVIPISKRNAYVQFFLDIVLERDLKNQSGISDFLQYWDSHSEKLSIPSPERNDAVRIMTIHKSKGLEFPVVIFPFAEEDYSKGPREKMWLNVEDEAIGLSKALVDKSSRIEGYGADANALYQQKIQEELLDNINILYVALTRAEEQLYIISGMQDRNSDNNLPKNMASFFISFLEMKGMYVEGQLDYTFGQQKKLSEVTAVADTTTTIPQLAATLEAKNIKISQRESLMWDTQQQKAIEYGTVLHEILSYVGTKDDIELAVTKAIENGLIVASQRDLVEQTLLSIVTHEDLTDYFQTTAKILNEKTILQKEGPLVKPDRMVITSDHEVYLLDYKTGAHQAKYTIQLENYKLAIVKMGYKVIKKALVYIGEQLEIVNL